MGKRGNVAVMAKRTSGKAVSVSGNCLAPSVGITKRAKTVWKQVLAAFPVGHFTESDRILLEQYCEAAALHRSATAMLSKEGRYYKDSKGIERRHPAADDQRRARYECSMLATKLRITKQAMISPKVAGRAAHDASEAVTVQNQFEGLLFGENETRQ
jgi:P27 family predicted phage terminase small subunit